MRNVPHDLTGRAGPGLTTAPLTPRIVHTITVRLPHPLRAAAVAALLFTGTATSLLSMTQIASVDEDGITVAIDLHRRIDLGVPPGPRRLYAVAPRARLLLRAALEFRRRAARTAAGHDLFADCFGTAPRFEALIAGAGLPVPAPIHPHTDDWRTAARSSGTCTPHHPPPMPCRASGSYARDRPTLTARRSFHARLRPDVRLRLPGPAPVLRTPPADQYRIAGVLLLVGVVLWAVARFTRRGLFRPRAGQPDESAPH